MSVPEFDRPASTSSRVGLVRGVGRDAIWSTVTLVVSAATTLPLFGYAVRRVGVAEFGIFAVITSVVSLLAVADFSFGTTVIRAMAREVGATTPGDRLAAREDVATAHGALWVVGVFIAALTIPVALLLPALTTVPTGVETEAFVTVVLVGAAAAIGIGSAALPAVLRGARRFALFSGSTLLGVAVRAILVLFLAGPLGLRSLGIAQFAAVCAERAAQLVAVRRHASWFRCRPRRTSVAALRRMGAFAVPLVVLAVDAQIVAASDALLIGALLGPTQVTLYRAGVVIPRQVAGVLLGAIGAVFPSLAGTDNRSEQTEVMRLVTRTACYVGGLALAGAALFRRDLVQLLLGQSSATAEAVLLIYSLTLAFDVGLHGMVLVLMARGRQWIMAALSPLQLTLNLTLTVTLVRRLGPQGAAVAALVTFGVIDLLLFPYMARRDFSPRASRIIVWDVLRPAALGAVVCLISGGALRTVLEPSATRVFLGALLTGAVGLVVGLGVLRPAGRVQLRAALTR